MSDVLDSYELEKKYGDVEYAGFWIRFGAAIIDGLVMIPFSFLIVYNIISMKSLALAFFLVVITGIYKPLMEFKYGATLGKMATNIKVVSLNYGPISMNQAIIRYSPWIIGHVLNIFTLMSIFSSANFENTLSFVEYSALVSEGNSVDGIAGLVILSVGIIIVFDAQKRGGHDMLAKTFCIHN
ncbi:MAG: putative RDD family membrane protein YckC [Patiriisocius sp.]|jgi:uncharacterized RDD family membrane protein YckC